MILIDEVEHPWHEGMTIAQMLREHCENRFCAVVRVNDKLISSPNFAKTPVPDNAKIYLLPMIAGG